MAKKISELPATTSPTNTVEIAVVEGGVTKRTTVANLAPAMKSSVIGWFDVGHSAGVSSSIPSATPTQVIVDGLDSNQGGFDFLPAGLIDTDVYDKAQSRILLTELSLGALISVQATGSYSTVTANTNITLVYRFFSSSDSLIFSRGINLFFKNTGAHEMAFVMQAFVGAPIVGGYIELEIEFDTGATNTVLMGGFLVRIDK